jgi:hypothetical protein
MFDDAMTNPNTIHLSGLLMRVVSNQDNYQIIRFPHFYGLKMP